jgi:phage shock protein PspC (stress-responsive transcriptional regulator)
MESHDPNQPQRPEEGPNEGASEERPPESEPTGANGPRRLYRSRSDRVIAGVCGGLGRYLNIDPIVLRIAFVVLLVFGGVSALAYVAAMLLVPSEPEGGGAGGTPAGTGGALLGGGADGRNRTLAIVAVVVLLLIAWPFLLGGGMMILMVAVPLAILALAGLVVWWVVSGEGPRGDAGDVARRSLLGVAVLLVALVIFIAGGWAAAVGGGAVAAGLVIAAGLGLVVGAFLGRGRILIVPALALALGVGFVSAAGIDLDGGIGDHEYTPASAAELADRYELGMGRLTVDLREADLPAGDTALELDLGMGQANLVVPEDVCVATTARVGMGNVESFGDDNGGVDVDFDDQSSAATGNSRVVVDADVGLGMFRVSHEAVEDHGPFGDRDFGGGPFDADEDRSGNSGCVTEAAGA